MLFFPLYINGLNDNWSSLKRDFYRMYLGSSYKSNKLNIIGMILLSTKSSRSKETLTHN